MMPGPKDGLLVAIGDDVLLESISLLICAFFATMLFFSAFCGYDFLLALVLGLR